MPIVLHGKRPTFGSVQLDGANHPTYAGGVDIELGGLAVPLGGGGGDNAVAQGIVHDAGGPTAGVATHGDDVAAAPDGDRGLGRSGTGIQSPKQRFELAEEPLPGGMHLATS